jgi:hypothetical protein
MLGLLSVGELPSSWNCGGTASLPVELKNRRRCADKSAASTAFGVCIGIDGDVGSAASVSSVNTGEPAVAADVTDVERVGPSLVPRRLVAAAAVAKGPD